MTARSLLLALLVAGCSVEELQETEGCTSTSDCDLGQVCHRPSFTCVPEPEDAVMGAFECDVFSDAVPRAPGSYGRSEIVGSLEGTRLALIGDVSCKLDEDGLTIIALTSNISSTRRAYSAWAIIAGGGGITTASEVEIQFDGTTYPGGVRFFDIQTGTLEIVGGVEHGRIVLDRAPVLGERLTGFADIRLDPLTLP